MSFKAFEVWKKNVQCVRCCLRFRDVSWDVPVVPRMMSGHNRYWMYLIYSPECFSTWTQILFLCLFLFLLYSVLKYGKKINSCLARETYMQWLYFKKHIYTASETQPKNFVLNLRAELCTATENEFGVLKNVSAVCHFMSVYCNIYIFKNL